MCGVCGIWSPANADPSEAARLMFFSLYALQHRGQESAGLAATDGRDLRVVRRMGLVGQVFSEDDLQILGGRAAMGHTRYSTTGASKIQNAQPFVVRDATLGELADVLSRPKFDPYVSVEDRQEFIRVLNRVAERVDIIAPREYIER